MAPVLILPPQDQTSFLGQSPSLASCNTSYGSHRTALHGINLLNSEPEGVYFPDLPSEELLEAAFEALSVQSGDEWIVDSRTSAYFSGNRSSFSQIDLFYHNLVTSAGGKSHCIEGQGTSEITLPSSEIRTIRDVQYVHGLY